MNNKNTNNNNSYLVEKVAIDLITMIPRFEANCLAYFKVLETQLTVIQNVYEFIIYILMKRYFVFVLCPKRNFGGGGGGGGAYSKCTVRPASCPVHISYIL